MNILKKSDEVKIFSRSVKDSKTIGFVPTMGALHEGHISLVQRAKSENDMCIVSIFVNPTQFNNPDDLQKYPRTLDADLDLLRKAGTDLVFLPDEREMYPEKDRRVFDLGGLDTIMEGEFRPGHFNGVAQIVSKLFDIVLPDKAYFGKKDFQQLAVIQHLNRQYFSGKNIEIVPCEIVRESDGLAMSSRNMRLSPEHRRASVLISQTLKNTVDDNKKIEEIKQSVIQKINSNSLLKTEYFEIVDNNTLKPVTQIIKGQCTGCIAVFAGDVRLIDNISY